MASEATGFLQTDGPFWARRVAGSVIPSSLGQICIAVATVSPLLAYPFLPHRNRWCGEYIPAGTLVLISKYQLLSHVGIVLFSTRDVLNRSTAAPIAVNAWPLYLNIFILAASHPAIYFTEESGLVLEPSDFRLAGHWACCSLLYFLFGVFDTLLDRNPAYAFALATLVVYCIREKLMDYTTRYTRAFITRNVSFPRWLWPSLGTNDFDSEWTVWFSMALLIVQVILILVALAYVLKDR